MLKRIEVLNLIDSGFILVNAHLEIVHWNKWLEKHSNFKSEQVIGKKIDDIFPKTKLRLLEIIEDSILLGSSSIISDRFSQNIFPLFHNIFSEGEMIQKIQTSRLKDDEGHKYCLIQITDTTISHQRENFLMMQAKEIKIKTEELENQTKMASLGRMASGIVHEINNPITIIKGYEYTYNSMKKKEVFDLEKMDEMFSKIQKMADRITSIIKGLKIIAHKDTFEFNQLANIKQIVDEAVELSRPKLEKTSVYIDYENIADNLEIWCDPVQISQIIINLISNAIDAIEDQTSPWIFISARSYDKWYEISIIDSGKGIPANIVKQMFDPFYTSKKVGKGTGLGLSISQKIAEAHKGELYVDQKMPNTTFVLKLIQSKYWGL